MCYAFRTPWRTVDKAAWECYHYIIYDGIAAESGMIRSQVQLTDEQVRALKELAHRENTPVAELVRRAVDYWLRSASPISPEERRKRAIAAAQGFPSGIADISERHDDYLAETYAKAGE
jgi:hypothetical protein